MFNINRRDLLKLSGGAAAASLLSGCMTGNAANGRKLNIIYIMTDDHAAHAIGAYGGRLAQLNPTPTLDKLASEGTLFTNAFAHNSICTPSRATIMTGQYSQANGVLDLDGSLTTPKQALSNEMSAAGYNTAMIGKWHLKEEPGSFDYYKVLPGQGDYFNPTFRVRGEKPWGRNTVQMEGHSSDCITDSALEWLQGREDARPFFLMYHFKAPHDMFEYAPRYESYLADTFIPEPVDLYERRPTWGSVATRGENDSLIHEIGTSVSKRHRLRNQGHHLGIDQSLPDREYTRASYQAYLKAYLRCVKGVDDNIARMFAYLEEAGLWDDTIIVYSSDQGFMLGEHDLIDKRWMYEESMQMPLIVRHPGIEGQAPTSDLIVNNTDYAPSLLDMAGVSAPEQMQGGSFVPALSGAVPAGWRGATYYRYWMHRAHHDVPAHFGIRTKSHKLIFFYGQHYLDNPPASFGAYDDPPGVRYTPERQPSNFATPPAWELYDLEKDPQELNNVYKDPFYANVVRDLKAELKRQRELYNETDEAYPRLAALIEKHWDD